MRFLRLCLLLYTCLYAEASFGTPYLQNSRLCHPWTCVSSKLGIPNELPPKHQFSATLKAVLPTSWHEAIERALETCYNDRPRNYVSTCTGQALLHCTVDNLIENCPEEYWNKNDACNPVSSLAGTKYMFTQSRYLDLEKNLPKEKRPAVYMKNYFDSRCCRLPKFVNSTVLQECGFDNFLHYYEHTPRTDKGRHIHFMEQMTTTHKPTSRKVLDVNIIDVLEKGQTDKGERLQIESATTDPLQCCDMSLLVSSESVSRCGFKPSWDKHERLVLGPGPTEAPPTTVRAAPAPLNRDVKMVPLSCEKETCIFQRLGIVSSSGAVDTTALSKLLDNFTATYPEWRKAKARAMTMCLGNANHGYKGDCEINKVLGCTLDLLTENCPYISKHDPCRHSKRNNTVCQISNSMYRPKHRRSVCGLPHLVDSSVLTACGVTSISRTEFAPETPVAKPYDWRDSLVKCKDNPATTCLMASMGVLNSYGFMDHFKMTSLARLAGDIYASAVSAPRYREYCTSASKLLSVFDAMVTTCPVSKRKNTTDCNALFKELNATDGVTDTRAKLNQTIQHFSHMFFPHTTPKTQKYTVTYKKTNPLFNFGVLNSSNVPQVRTVKLDNNKKIPVLLPVYMRLKGSPLRMDTSSLGKYNNGVFQSPSYLLRGKLSTTNSMAPLMPPGLP